MKPDYPPILDQLGLGPPISLTGVGGGCIAEAKFARFADGSEVFVKTLAGQRDLFPREAEGLRVLAQANAVRVPKVLAVDTEGLVLERIRSAHKRQDYAETFGRNFARMHEFRGKACGFAHHNYIGANVQRNDPIGGDWNEVSDETGSNWAEFFIERRLRFQADLAAEQGYGSELQELLDRAQPLIEELLNCAIEAPSILHGDLWSGNAIVDEKGEACLIDPAVYFGHREADLAMTRLFGGFEPAFYHAYDEALPLSAGHQERLPIYQLYHIMNHLNLFGGGYFDQSRRILGNYAG